MAPTISAAEFAFLIAGFTGFSVWSLTATDILSSKKEIVARARRPSTILNVGAFLYIATVQLAVALPSVGDTERLAAIIFVEYEFISFLWNRKTCQKGFALSMLYIVLVVLIKAIAMNVRGSRILITEQNDALVGLTVFRGNWASASFGNIRSWRFLLITIIQRIVIGVIDSLPKTAALITTVLVSGVVSAIHFTRKDFIPDSSWDVYNLAYNTAGPLLGISLLLPFVVVFIWILADGNETTEGDAENTDEENADAENGDGENADAENGGGENAGENGDEVAKEPESNVKSMGERFSEFINEMKAQVPGGLRI